MRHSIDKAQKEEFEQMTIKDTWNDLIFLHSQGRHCSAEKPRPKIAYSNMPVSATLCKKEIHRSPVTHLFPKSVKWIVPPMAFGVPVAIHCKSIFVSL